MHMLFERHPDTTAVISVLRGVNDEITYADLARRAGLDIPRMKQVLQSARNFIRAESGVLFGTVRGFGLQRMSDADKVRKPEAFKKRVFRGAGRELRDLGTISNFGELSKAEQHSVTINRTVLGAFRRTANVKPEKTKTSPPPLPDVDALTASRRKMKKK